MLGRFLQIARFCAVGLLCLVASTTAFALLCEVGHVNYSLAFALCFIFSNVLGFCLNARFTFNLRRRFDRASLVRYMIVNGSLLVLNLALLRVLVDTLHVWYIAATVIIAALNLPVSFIAHRVISYRLRPTAT